MTDPIVVEFVVACGPAHAFDVWSSRISQWWPADHTLSGDSDAEVVLEPKEGGRIVERAPDGTEHEWGVVIRWEPPGLLAYAWHLGTDADQATDVVITFTPDQAGTKVRVMHSGWDQFGPHAPERRDANVAGWDALLPHFVAACGSNADRSTR